MANPLTITAVTGPAQAVTAKVIPDVSRIVVDFIAQTVKVTPNGSTTYTEYDIKADTTFTITISGTTYTLTIS